MHRARSLVHTVSTKTCGVRWIRESNELVSLLIKLRKGERSAMLVKNVADTEWQAIRKGGDAKQRKLSNMLGHGCVKGTTCNNWTQNLNWGFVYLLDQWMQQLDPRTLDDFECRWVVPLDNMKSAIDARGSISYNWNLHEVPAQSNVKMTRKLEGHFDIQAFTAAVEVQDEAVIAMRAQFLSICERPTEYHRPKMNSLSMESGMVYFAIPTSSWTKPVIIPYKTVQAGSMIWSYSPLILSFRRLALSIQKDTKDSCGYASLKLSTSYSRSVGRETASIEWKICGNGHKAVLVRRSSA